MTTAVTVLGASAMQTLTQRSWAWGLGYVAVNYGLIIAAFALAITWTNPLTILVAIAIIGGRQLGLAVLMHECAHYTLLPRRRWNVLVGRWLCAWPVHADYDAYRAYHLDHHAHAGTPRDPDLALVAGYPATPASLKRKFIRDATGQTAMRDLLALWRRADGLDRLKILGFHVLLGAVLAALGALWAISLWWAAYLFVYPVIIRLRLIGEHGTVPDRLDADTRRNTATVLPSLLEKLIIAPNNVSYHLEHHLAAGVPAYQLRAFHKALRQAGYYRPQDRIYRSYKDVLKDAASAKGHSGPQRPIGETHAA